MTKAQFKKEMVKIEKFQKKRYEFAEDMGKLLGVEPVYFSLLDEAEMYHVNLLALLSGIGEGWLSWFIYENDFGAGGVEALGAHGKRQTIKSSDELWDFMKEYK